MGGSIASSPERPWEAVIAGCITMALFSVRTFYSLGFSISGADPAAFRWRFRTLWFAGCPEHGPFEGGGPALVRAAGEHIGEARHIVARTIPAAESPLAKLEIVAGGVVEDLGSSWPKLIVMRSCIRLCNQGYREQDAR